MLTICFALAFFILQIILCVHSPILYVYSVATVRYRNEPIALDCLFVGINWHFLFVTVYDKLESRYGHVSYERLLSGQGLSNIFSIILKELESGDSDTMACRPRQKMHPAQITAMAKSGNREALETFRIFSEILGAACGNYALTYMATGGIFIGGGMLPKILPLIDKEAFENAYLNKGRFKDFLDNIPVYVILDETAPSIGAMNCLK